MKMPWQPWNADKQELTSQEKEWLRQLMEEPDGEVQSDFFKDVDFHIPPPQNFMVGDPEPRPRPVYKLLKVAGFVVAVVVCATALATFMTPLPANADKGHFEMMAENLRNGFSMNGKDDEGIVAAVDTTINEETEIATAGKDLFPELLVPTYVPDGYAFDKLKISCDEEGLWGAQYLYEKDGKWVKIKQYRIEKEPGSIISNRTVGGETTEIGVIYHQTDATLETKNITIWKSDCERICISGNLDFEELERVYKGLTL